MLDVLIGARVLVAAMLITVVLVACKQVPGYAEEPPDLPGVPRVRVLVDQLHREYAANSLVFTQDRVNQPVIALGRVDRVFPDGMAIFLTDTGSGLWCTWEISEAGMSLEEGMWVLLRGKVTGIVEGRVWLERCEFREFHWGGEWVGET